MPWMPKHDTKFICLTDNSFRSYQTKSPYQRSRNNWVNIAQIVSIREAHEAVIDDSQVAGQEPATLVVLSTGVIVVKENITKILELIEDSG